MRVLLLITRAELGGGQTHVADLLEGLRDKFELVLGTGETGYLTDVADQLGIRWRLIPDLVQPMLPMRDLRAVKQCVRLIREIRPDVVHAHTSKAGTIGRLAARLAGVPSVFTAHTWCFAEGTSWKWKAVGVPIERLAARLSARIITVSEANRELALRHEIAGPSTFVTVHNGIGDTEWRADPGTDGVPRIVMVARFSAQKAPELMLEAVKDLEMPFHLTFVGDGPGRAGVEQRVSDLGLGDRVEFLGQRRDIPQILAGAHIFTLFTNWEGFPISILEAMRAGLPVLASDVNGVHEAVQDGVTGFLAAVRDVAMFRGRLRQLLENRELRRQMGAEGRRRFEREFTAATMLERTGAIYREAAGRPQKSPEKRSAPALGFQVPNTQSVSTKTSE